MQITRRTLSATVSGTSTVSIATGTWTVKSPTGSLVKSSVFKAAAGVLRDAYAEVDTALAAGTYFVMMFNATALPADGATPHQAPVPVQPGGYVSFDYGLDGLSFSTGIVFALSSTQNTLTLVGSNAAHFSGRYS